VLEIFQDASVQPKAADDPYRGLARAVAHHRYRRRTGISDEVLKPPRKTGSHHLLCRQQRQDGEQDNAEPGEDLKGGQDQARAHQRTVLDGDPFGKLVKLRAQPARPASRTTR
jgi:hypothetical protein